MTAMMVMMENQQQEGIKLLPGLKSLRFVIFEHANWSIVLIPIIDAFWTEGAAPARQPSPQSGPRHIVYCSIAAAIIIQWQFGCKDSWSISVSYQNTDEASRQICCLPC